MREKQIKTSIFTFITIMGMFFLLSIPKQTIGEAAAVIDNGKTKLQPEEPLILGLEKNIRDASRSEVVSENLCSTPVKSCKNLSEFADSNTNEKSIYSDKIGIKVLNQLREQRKGRSIDLPKELVLAPNNSNNKLINRLRLERTIRIMKAASYTLRLGVDKTKVLEKSNQILTVSLESILSPSNVILPEDYIPMQLREHLNNAMILTKESPELGFTTAASLCEKWKSPAQSEFIFSELIKTCQKLSIDGGTEMTVVMFRSFVQKLKNDEIHHLARLRIGRLYYENGELGKAVVELDVDQGIKQPSPSYSLAGLIKAMALIRLGQSAQALSLLEWVAECSQDIKQQARAAFVIGRINLLYNHHDLAEKWLKKVAYELADQTYRQQAQKLLSQMSEKRRLK